MTNYEPDQAYGSLRHRDFAPVPHSHSLALFGWLGQTGARQSLSHERSKAGNDAGRCCCPLANISLILISALALRALPFSAPPLLFDLFKYCCAINIILALFNLVPIPPLDGSRVVAGILPPKLREIYVGMERYGIFIIIGLLYLGLLDAVIIPLYRVIFYFLVQA